MTIAKKFIQVVAEWSLISLELNDTPDGWIPLEKLNLTPEEIDQAMVYILEVEEKMARFIETDILNIYRWYK